MVLDIQTLANLAAEKIRGRYSASHAAHSALKGLEIPAEERERLFHEILSELSRRSKARRKKNKKTVQKATERTTRMLKKIIQEEHGREARRMAHERRDHLLPDP